MIIDAMAESGEGYEFVRWLRANVPEPNRHTPVLLTAAHTKASDVANARDCGSHFIVAKPLAPIVVLERIIWIAKEGRAFVLSDEYVGPDRRFAKSGAIADHPRRRREDQIALQDEAAAESARRGAARGRRGSLHRPPVESRVMSSVGYEFPKYKLTSQLRETGRHGGRRGGGSGRRQPRGAAPGLRRRAAERGGGGACLLPDLPGQLRCRGVAAALRDLGARGRHRRGLRRARGGRHLRQPLQPPGPPRR